MITKSLSIITATLLLTTNIFAEETLGDITIISANKTAQSIKNTTSNVTVITAEDIEENGYQTVSEAINTIAGISVGMSGGLGQKSSFFLRGSDSGQILVLIDGMRLNDPSTTNGQALLENLTTSNISQIEVVKGGMSSIWGSNASSGVINIITKEAKDGTHGSLGLSYGSHNTKGINANIAYKNDKLSVQFLSSKIISDGISAKSPRSEESDNYDNTNYNLKLGYAFNTHHRLNLNYNSTESDIDYDSTPDDSLSTINSKQKNISLSYQYTLDNYTATLSASNGKYDREDHNAFGGMSTFDSKVKEYSFINSYNYIQGKVILGLEYKDISGDTQYKSQFYNPPASIADYMNKAIFISNTYNINQNTLLETNLRYDNFNNFENKTTYKIGLKHHHVFLEGFTSSANYYTSYDAPSTYQISDALVSKALTPSYTKGYDVSLSYKKLLSVTYFNNTVEDFIDYFSNPLTYEDWYQNIDGTLKFSGLELETAYTFEEQNIILSANYTHLFEYEDDNNQKLQRRAEDTFNASLSYYTEDNTHFGISTQYIGDRIEYTYNTYDIKASTGNYTIWNLNFNTKIFNDIDFSIHAKNIFDKDYETISTYATEGRSIYAKVKYSF